LITRLDFLLADFRRPADAEANGVICPEIRQCHRVSRKRRGDVLLMNLLDAGQVGLPSQIASARCTSSWKRLPSDDGQRTEDRSD